MVTSLYLTSIEPAGKTAISAFLGKDFIKKGKKVAYFVPVKFKLDSEEEYRDASFLKDVLNLEDDIGKISPFHFEPMELWKELTVNTDEFNNKLRGAYENITREKDIVIIEGLSGLVTDGTATLACYTISELFNSSVILLLRYSDKFEPAFLKKAQNELKGRLTGVIINFVPEHKLDYVRKETGKLIESAGIKIIGFIPEQRFLLGVTVGELARALNGNVLTASGRMDEIVENLMLGALTIDSGISYFSRKKNKAVILRSERPDMQLAALETSTSCIISVGTKPPIDSVMYQAEKKKVPIILVSKTIPEIIEVVEEVLARSVFNNQKKLKSFQQIAEKHLDFKQLNLDPIG